MNRHPAPSPSPFDGYVHLLTECTTDRRANVRRLTVGCGAEMPAYVCHGPLGGVTSWSSQATCPPCRARVGLVP